jgi:hypothetical protein
VDEPENGYQSDFDLLIIVSHPNLTDIADYWYIAEDKILREQAIGRPVNIIVHSLQEVNQALEGSILGRYRPGWDRALRSSRPFAGNSEAADA